MLSIVDEAHNTARAIKKDHLRKAEKKRARKPKPKDKSAGVGYGTTGVPGAYGSGMFNDIADEDLIAADEAALMAEVHGRREVSPSYPKTSWTKSSRNLPSGQRIV